MTARILVVDDVPANARLLEARLAAEYYQVAVAVDGYDAIGQARDWQPDLILLDVMMPGMDGYACCRRLKALEATRHIPVVMVTALGEASERLAGLADGADDFLTKPVDFDTLLARLRSLVRTKRLLDELRARGETGRALGIGLDHSGVAPVAGARVLVIDDWPAGAQQVRAALSEDGMRVVVAGDGGAAVALTGQFDLLVLSLSLLCDDPLALASRLRAEDDTRETPLLLIAESSERARVLRGFDLGANDWLLQPLDTRELRVRARNLVRRKIYRDRLRAELIETLALAITDPVTGLHNKRYLLHHLGSLMRSPAAQPLGVAMIDIDHFKRVNDQHGHAAGDRALRAVADRLRASTRVFDSFARVGGEEFVLVMPGTGATECVVAAERIRALVEAASFALGGAAEPVRITISVGVAVRCEQDVDAQALLEWADTALYQAKSDGRNRVRLAADPDAAT